MEKIGVLKRLNSKEIDKSILSIGFECADRELFKPEKCYDAAAEVGFKYARLSSGWARTEKQAGIYDFTWLDEMVDSLLERKIQPWFNVVYGNPVYMPDAPNKNASGCTPMRYGKEVLEAWLKYVEALATHFKGRVTHYEIWNEANSSLFWYPNKGVGDVDMRSFAELVKVSGKVIRKIDPNAKIGTNLDGRAFCGEEDWYGDFFPCLTPGELDFFCFHIYAISPENMFHTNVKHLREVMDSFGLESTEIWQGESGFPSWFVPNHSLNPKSQSNERRQAVNVLRRYLLDSSENLGLSNIYHMVDLWEGSYALPGLKYTKDSAWGLLNGLEYTPKKVFYALGYAGTVLSGDVTCLDHSIPVNEVDQYAEPTEPVRFVFEKNKKPLYAYFLPTDIEAEVPTVTGYTFTVNTSGGEKPLTDPILIDMYNGTVYSISGKRDENGNTVYEDLPLAEYPFIICDRDMFEIIK